MGAGLSYDKGEGFWLAGHESPSLRGQRHVWYATSSSTTIVKEHRVKKFGTLSDAIDLAEFRVLTFGWENTKHREKFLYE